LDKYYNDLTTENVSKWVDGHGDLPENLVRFALTLPFWKEGTQPPKPFRELGEDMNQEDLRQMAAHGLSQRYLQTIGFKNFASFMERKIERMFVDSIGPVLANLRGLRISAEKHAKALSTEFAETSTQNLEHHTRLWRFIRNGIHARDGRRARPEASDEHGR